MSELVLENDEGAVRTLTLNRPQKKNALDPALSRAFTEALARADADEAVKVVVVTGAGDVFCGGADVGTFLAIAAGQAESVLPIKEVPGAIRAVRKPILASLQGRTVGMGVTMLPAFDAVYAADHATFMIPFVRLGLVQEFGSSWAMPRLIGRQRFAEMLLRGNAVDAQTALVWGLATRVFPAATLAAEVAAIAAEIAAAPFGALLEAKRLLRAGEEEHPSLQAAENAEDAVLAVRYGSAENLAAVQAFLASRRR
ncbi:MAG: enoyl-CoA hydratase/isomerase family protein [Myxococcales bacterium]|nr:enoyl-CoA hydratase/isomerase family protein [Myxococcales bacterium]